MPKGLHKVQSECHPDRPAYAYGKCNACYRRERYRDNPEYRDICKKATRDFYVRNSDKCNDRQKRRYVANRDAIKMKQRLNNHGITLEFLSGLFEKQNGQCAICGKQLKSINSLTTHIDHDHVTRQVRGLLCHKCNTGIGWLEKNLAYLNPVLSYIRISERN